MSARRRAAIRENLLDQDAASALELGCDCAGCNAERHALTLTGALHVLCEDALLGDPMHQNTVEYYRDRARAIRQDLELLARPAGSDSLH
jgi:hypothetical protein